MTLALKILRVTMISSALIAHFRAEGGKPQLHVEWLASRTGTRTTELPYSADDIVRSPDGQRIAYSMLVRDEEASLGSTREKLDGAKWGDPLQIIDVSYRVDGEGHRLSTNTAAGARGRLSHSNHIPEQSVTEAPDRAEESKEDLIEDKNGGSTRTQQPDATAAASVNPQTDDSPDPGKGAPNGSNSDDDSDAPY